MTVSEVPLWVLIICVLAAVAAGVVAGLALGGRRRGWRFTGRSGSEASSSPGVPEESGDLVARSVVEFAETVPQVWTAQLESCRSQMEGSVTGVTERFGGIVSSLDSVLASSSAAFDGGHGGVFERGRQRLADAVATLDQALSAKRESLDELNALIGLSGDLKQMVSEVTQIARQTNLLALNAGIEAARVGKAGAGFRVVASEVRGLADRSLNTSERIAVNVSAIGAAIGLVVAAANEGTELENAAVARANDEVRSVLDDLLGVVSTFQRTSDQLEETAIGIRAEVAKSLVDLQFQDRVCQVLEHLKNSVEHMRSLAVEVGPSRPLDSRALLDDLADNYSMREERQAHDSGVVAEVPESEITFF